MHETTFRPSRSLVNSLDKPPVCSVADFLENFKESRQKMALKIVTDTFTISILAVRTWQDIWSRSFSEANIRYTLEKLIHSELQSLNADYRDYIAKNGINIRWVAQEELWKQIQCNNPIVHSRLIPIILR